MPISHLLMKCPLCSRWAESNWSTDSLLLLFPLCMLAAPQPVGWAAAVVIQPLQAFWLRNTPPTQALLDLQVLF